MRRFALIFALWPGVLTAGDFQKLSGEEILSALAGKKLEYGSGVWQVFEASMTTQYFSGGPSVGRWAVRGDQYCSTWPPADLWACYDVWRNGDAIRFVDDAGGQTVGVYAQ